MDYISYDLNPYIEKAKKILRIKESEEGIEYYLFYQPLTCGDTSCGAGIGGQAIATCNKVTVFVYGIDKNIVSILFAGNSTPKVTEIPKERFGNLLQIINHNN